MNYTDSEAKEQLVAVCHRMYEKNYCVSNDGNVSLMMPDGTIWCTPTGVCKGDITAQMLIKIDREGNIISGTYKPSSEIKMHLRIYRENAAIGAVVHAHPPMATAFACAGMALEEPILAEALLKLGKVPLVEYATLGTSQLADKVAPYCRKYNSLLLANHGVVCFDRRLWDSYYLLESTEQYAKILLYTHLLGAQIPLSDAEIAKIKRK